MASGEGLHNYTIINEQLCARCPLTAAASVWKYTLPYSVSTQYYYELMEKSCQMACTDELPQRGIKKRTETSIVIKG